MAALTLNKKAAPTPGAAFEDLFGGVRNVIKDIPGADLVEYKTADNQPQPFRPYTPEKLARLAESIQENGILSPIIVRPQQPSAECPYNCYQILAGHNRFHAGKLAGLEIFPCIVKENCNDAQAQYIMTTTNLDQRDELSISEKAWGYRLQQDSLEALSGPGGKTVAAIAEQSEDNVRKISRLIRLTYLIPELLADVDSNALSQRAGYELSYLDDVAQKTLYDYLTENSDIPYPTEEKAIAIKRLVQELNGFLDTETLDKVFGVVTTETEDKVCTPKEESVSFKIPKDIFDTYFPAMKKKEALNCILKILEQTKESGNWPM